MQHQNKSGYRHRYQSAPIGLVLVGIPSDPLGQRLAGYGLFTGFEFFPMLALLEGFLVTVGSALLNQVFSLHCSLSTEHFI